MAGRPDEFSQAVSQFGIKTKKKILLTFQGACRLLVNEAQRSTRQGGRMRIKTGFLRASLEASKSHVPLINPLAYPAPNSYYVWNDADVMAVISSLKIGDTFYMGYTAAYAAHREYGHHGLPPDAFLRGSHQKWNLFVQQSALQVQALR